MKVLPSDIGSMLAGPVVEPCFLIELEMDELLFLSTRQRYEFGGKVYEPGHVQGLRIAQDQLTFGLINEEHRYTTSALMGVYHRAPVRVWLTDGIATSYPLIEPGYVEDGYYIEEPRTPPILLFSGNVVQFSQITTVLGVVATRSAARSYPALRVLPPIANHVRPEGTQLSVSGNLFRLEARS